MGLAIAFVAAYPVNRALIARGRGHAVVHEAPTHADAEPVAPTPREPAVRVVLLPVLDRRPDEQRPDHHHRDDHEQQYENGFGRRA